MTPTFAQFIASSLYESIRHGDEAHQGWLKSKLEEWAKMIAKEPTMDERYDYELDEHEGYTIFQRGQRYTPLAWTKDVHFAEKVVAALNQDDKP